MKMKTFLDARKQDRFACSFKLGRSFEYQNFFEENSFFNIYSIDGKYKAQQKIMVDTMFEEYCRFIIIIPQTLWLKKWFYNYQTEKFGIEDGLRPFIHEENVEQSIDEWNLQVFRVRIDFDEAPPNLQIQFHGLDENQEKISWPKDIEINNSESETEMYNFISLGTKFIVLSFTYSHLNEGVDSEITFKIDVEKLEVKTNYLLLHLQNDTINSIINQLQNKSASPQGLQNLVYISSQNMDLQEYCENLLKRTEDDFELLNQSKLPERPRTSPEQKINNQARMNSTLEGFSRTINEGFQRFVFQRNQKESTEIQSNLHCMIVQDFLPLYDDNEKISKPLMKIKQCQQILTHETKDINQPLDTRKIEIAFNEQQQNVNLLKQQFEKLRPQLRQRGDVLNQIINLLQRLSDFNQQMLNDISNVKLIQRQMMESINQLKDEQAQILEEVQVILIQRLEHLKTENDEFRSIIEEKDKKLKEYNRETIKNIRKVQIYVNYSQSNF